MLVGLPVIRVVAVFSVTGPVFREVACVVRRAFDVSVVFNVAMLWTGSTIGCKLD